LHCILIVPYTEVIKENRQQLDCWRNNSLFVISILIYGLPTRRSEDMVESSYQGNQYSVVS
jgi:hypothetical protein